MEQENSEALNYWNPTTCYLLIDQSKDTIKCKVYLKLHLKYVLALDQGNDLWSSDLSEAQAH